MAQESPRLVSGPKFFRLAIYFFSLLLTILLIWLGKFVLQDIDSIPAPKIKESSLLKQRESLYKRIEELNNQIKIAEEERRYLKDSVSASQQTLNQLLELRRQSIEKSLPITPEESRAFTESQRLFLKNQERLQSTMAKILELRNERSNCEEKAKAIERQIGEKRRPILRRHRRLLALLKFLFMAPFVVLGTWLFVKKRSTTYAPIIYAFDFAILYLLIRIIHQHFPARHYKYLFVIVAIMAVLVIIKHLIRLFARPSKVWLLKRYRESYKNLRCPICQYPLLFGEGRTFKKEHPFRFVLPLSLLREEGVKEYRCPSCGSLLFETCTNCQNMRHSLLPYCQHCGAVKSELLPTA